MKTLIICGPPRSGTTGLTELINSSKTSFVSCELASFHPNATILDVNIKKPQIETIRALKNKNWNIKQVYQMIRSNTYPQDLEIFGDKHPDYCLNQHIANHLVNTYAENAYFIFTTRKMHGIVCSFFKRTKIDHNPNARWFTNDTTTALQRIREYYDNMIFMYPKIKNKILVSYDDAMQDPYYIHDKLKKFLNLNIPLDTIESEYKNDQYDDWKINLNNEQKSIIDEFLNTYINIKEITPF